MNYPQPITESFAWVVSRAQEICLSEIQAAKPGIVNLNYQFGPIKELQQTLTKMQEGQTAINKMWPLVWLVEDITLDRRDSKQYAKTAVRVIIAFPTDATYKSSARETYIFAPILRPVYRAFLQAISQSFALGNPDEEQGIPHRYTERKYWGADNQAATQLTEFVDAIDIEQLEVKINYQSCFNSIN